MRIEELHIGVMDVETTGLDKEKDKIVEAAIVWAGVDGIHGHRSCLFNPGIPIPASASACHHIIDSDVEGISEFNQLEWFSGDAIDVDCYAAHNAEFDAAFLDPVPKPIICTMRLAQKLWGDLESYGNQFLRYQLKLNPPVSRSDAIHRALPDAIVTATLLIRELQELNSRATDPNSFTVEGLVEWIAKPMLLKTIRFGKHKGMLWNEVPRDYLRWIVDKMTDADSDTIYTAKWYLSH